MEFFSALKRHPLHALRVGAERGVFHYLRFWRCSLVTRGLHLSVEFTGGTVMEVAYTQTADCRGCVKRWRRWAMPTWWCKTLAPSRDVMIRLPVQRA